MNLFSAVEQYDQKCKEIQGGRVNKKANGIPNWRKRLTYLRT